MNKNMKIRVFFLIFFSCALLASGATDSVKKKCDVFTLFKEGRYKEIIEYSQHEKLTAECDILLVAKSYERLGLYTKSIGIFKDLDSRNSRFQDYIAFFIAENYTRIKDYQNALRWYRTILVSPYEYPDTYAGSTDRNTLFVVAAKKVMEIGIKQQKYSNFAERILKRASIDSRISSYFQGVFYQRLGQYRLSAEAYYQLLQGESEFYQKKAIEQVSYSFKLIKQLGEMGLEESDLIHLCIKHKLYRGALLISYLLPYNMYTAQLRAYCFYESEDFQSAEALYREYYTQFRDTEALVRIAYSQYYLRRNEQARSTLETYVEKKREEKRAISADAHFLLLLLRRNDGDVEKYTNDALGFVQKYKAYAKLESFIEETFYLIMQENVDLAVNFLLDIHQYIKSPHYKAWASYMLGVYVDRSYFPAAITNNPGSYYYFVSSGEVELNRNMIKTADRLYNQDRINDALEIYIRLFSDGMQKKYTEGKIVQILSGIAPYTYFYQIDAIHTGAQESVLYDLFRFGLFEELEKILEPDFFENNAKENIFYYYLLSKIAYESGDAYLGILNAERMLHLAEPYYLIFFPEEILTLLYPYVYSEEIDMYREISDSNLDSCFILAIIREESRYNIKARSRSGALGLMQIMPGTANWIHRRSTTRADLFQPALNIQIGIKYLEYLINRFGSSYLVLAAYNGGPTNLSKWIELYDEGEIYKFIERIPFPETRNYIKKVIASYGMYRAIYSMKCM
jgi:soluble lytic murein transglycosylase